MKSHSIRILLLGLFMAFVVVCRGADEPESANRETDGEPATVKIRGVGWFRARELRQTLRLLEPEGQRLETVGTAFIEDAVVLLQSAMESDGFLRSTGVARVLSGGELVGDFEWTAGEVPIVPRGVAANRVVFRLEPGVRYRFRNIECTRLTAIAADRVQDYFVEEGFLLGGGEARLFTPGKLRNGTSNLREQLQRMGYADAEVNAEVVGQDDETGDVDVVLKVAEGPLHRVGEVSVSGDLPDDVRDEVHQRAADANGVVYSVLWRQDFMQSFRSLLYDHGYPAVEVGMDSVSTQTVGSEQHRSFNLVIVSGPQVRIGEVRFEGEVKTKDEVMRRSARIKSGELFRRGDVEGGRIRLGALGAFSSVRTEADPVESNVWDVVYVVRPAKKLDVSLLAGWGSYEQLRGGIELKHGDLLGFAHRGRLSLIQSMKSTSADYLYSMPQFLGSRNDASVRFFGLAREEVSFDRREVGTSFGLRRRLESIGTDAGLRYQYESLRALNFTGDPNEAPTNTRVGTFILDLTRDRLDNPISPRNGYLLSGSFETAAQVFGGDVNYERMEFGIGWHAQLASQSFVHVGLRQGLIWAFGESMTEIPLLRRFLPGGEDTIRGYGQGRASPRDDAGNEIGAETVTTLNLEFEQALTESFSGVVFVDAGVMGAKLSSFPGDEQRVSVGVGLRYNTVIGPVRLEYGRNVVTEPGDEKGHLHFALGFPF